MAVVRTVSEDGLYQTHKSDANKYIKKVGTEEIYSEAIDLISINYEYEETDKEIETEKEEEPSAE